MTLYKVPERKTKLDRYLLVNLFIVFIFTLTVYGIHREKIKQLFGGMFKPIKELLLLLIFAGKKKEESEASDKNNKSPVPITNANQPPSATPDIQDKIKGYLNQLPPNIQDKIKNVNPNTINEVKGYLNQLPPFIRNIANKALDSNIAKNLMGAIQQPASPPLGTAVTPSSSVAATNATPQPAPATKAAPVPATKAPK